MLLRRSGDWETATTASESPEQLENIVPLHAASVLSALRRRHFHGRPFTACGPILLSLNSFKSGTMPYSDDAAAVYRGKSVAQLADAPPHAYCIAVRQRAPGSPLFASP